LWYGATKPKVLEVMDNQGEIMLAGWWLDVASLLMVMLPKVKV
jgi:hypothetical protein